MGEDEIKGLEEEIDSAVDRLFIEKKGGIPESPFKKPPLKEPTFKLEKDLDLETAIREPSPESSFPKSIEKMESQLLSLEWEITKENLGKTKEEVLALRESLREKPDITSVLGLMEKVLSYMMKNEEQIRPPLVKFLLDSKETIKLLMKKGRDAELDTHKQLAYVGIQARYSCLEELKESRPERPAVDATGETEKQEILTEMDKQFGEILNRINVFFPRVEELFGKLDQYMRRVDQGIHGTSEQLLQSRPISMNITVVKVGGKLFGVESDKVVKLFKVPSAFHEKYTSQQKIRLKEFEVKMIDLRKLFSIKKGESGEELKILAVKDDGEYKGLMIEQILERLSAQADIGGAHGEYFLGTFRSTYQGRPLDISILDLRRL